MLSQEHLRFAVCSDGFHSIDLAQMESHLNASKASVLTHQLFRIHRIFFMAPFNSAAAGNNLLVDSPHSLSWLVQGSRWKDNKKVPVGWFLTQWLKQEQAWAQGNNSVGIERRIDTEEGQDYVLQLQLPKGLPPAAQLKVQWGGSVVASFNSLNSGGAESQSIGLTGLGKGGLLRLITDGGVDVGELRGFGLWAAPRPSANPLAMNTGTPLPGPNGANLPISSNT